MHRLLTEWRDKISKILFEGKKVSGAEITDAIEKQYCVLINYDDETEEHQTGTRLIEPFVYGLSSASNEVIRAFQYYGATRRGIPKYKLFRVDRITSWHPKENLHFKVEPKKLAQTNIAYNENGDKSMEMIFAQVHFTDTTTPQQLQSQEPQEWESPLDRVRRERLKTQQSIENQLNSKTNANKQGAVATNSLKAELKNDSSEFEQSINNSLGISNMNNTQRGAVEIGQDKYERDAKSQDEKHNDEILRRRDKRWKNAADTRPLWRKGSANDLMQQDNNSQ